MGKPHVLCKQFLSGQSKNHIAKTKAKGKAENHAR